ncbi:hypothetical protein [Dictyobacter kobayashii]|uniref:Uncharacterized protein n=1 Tax=Dictyobacter kobayashii TaxID=2014872 RepID=A0A402AZC8_9CHLR|nr:hypothetical protein [Dictyobacter kobayashii]GCE24442.1 hypothetical protein KDK_82420 [Dictyobacter kobayashii]
MKKINEEHKQNMNKSDFAEQELTEEQLEQIQGGLNPQPLPPGAADTFKLDNKIARQGIIIVSGYQE